MGAHNEAALSKPGNDLLKKAFLLYSCFANPVLRDGNSRKPQVAPRRYGRKHEIRKKAYAPYETPFMEEQPRKKCYSHTKAWPPHSSGRDASAKSISFRRRVDLWTFREEYVNSNPCPTPCNVISPNFCVYVPFSFCLGAHYFLPSTHGGRRTR